MSDKSGIEWTDATWNPVRGCSPVSTGCKNCYAARMATRFTGPGGPYEGLAKGGKWTGKVRLVPEALEQPLRWRKPRKIFVCSMSDLFHPDVPGDFILHVFEIMERAGQHMFQILTKRPERMIDVLGGSSGAGLSAPPLPNVQIGVSAENQEMADERVPLLLQTPAAVRFVSCEPLLGPVDLERFFVMHDRYGEPFAPRCNPDGSSALGWVVCGGESGPGARPMHPDWVRDIRDQCQAAGVPFMFKSWGEWGPGRVKHTALDFETRRAGELLPMTVVCSTNRKSIGSTNHTAVSADGTRTQKMYRVGKKAAGRELDGREWMGMP